jgi:uncharacterized protein (TIGR03067 family)
MTPRLALAALVMFGLTAFAPAPFPRAERGRKSDGLSLEQMQGTWAVLKLQSTHGNRPPTDSGTYLKEVQVSGDRWSFVYREGRNGSVNYNIRIDHTLQPPQLDFYTVATKGSDPYGRGILKRDGGTVQLLYTWSGSRAASFANPPDGHWLITLQRTR